MLMRDKLFIGGQWIAPSTEESIDVHSAGTGEVMGKVPAGGERDIDAAAAAAHAALQGWSQTPAEKRAEFLQKISDGLKARADEIAKTIAQEVGMPIKLAGRIQAGLPIANFANYAKIGREFKFEERVGNSVVVKEAVGVVGAITPWNYPLHQIALKVAPALAAGCTVVLKPSEVAPFNAFILAEVIEAAGLPKGVFNLVTGLGPVVGEALVKHPRVDMISFTGSTRAGKRISELAAQQVKRVALELGGKSASVILEDADLAAAVKGTVNGCYLNSGQTCTALTRMLVPASKYDEAAGPPPTRPAAASICSSEAPARPPSQHATGAAIRSDECAATPARSSTRLISSSVGASAPSSAAKASIHWRASIVRSYSRYLCNAYADVRPQPWRCGPCARRQRRHAAPLGSRRQARDGARRG
jgi:betaine-aldehyde dehydrogenase